LEDTAPRKKRKRSNRPIISMILHWNESQHPVKVLLDTGCSVTLINQQTIERLGIQTKMHKNPRIIENFTGEIVKGAGQSYMGTMRLQHRKHFSKETFEVAPMEAAIDIFLPFSCKDQDPPQWAWTNEEVQFNSAECMRKCSRHETGPFSLTWDESIATNSSTRVIGYNNRNQSQRSSYQIRIGGKGGTPVKSRSNRIPSVPRNHVKRGGRCPPRTPTLRLQNQSPGRKHGAMGAHLPPFRRRTQDPKRMADRNGKNGENQALHIPSRFTNPLRAETKRTRTMPMCRLPSPKSNHHPESVPNTSHAGTAGSGPRGAMVHKDGPQKWISPNPNPRRGRMENSVQNPIQAFRIPSYAVRTDQRPLHLPTYDEPHLFRHA